MSPSPSDQEPLRASARPRVDLVAAELRDSILRGEHAAGERLESERKLALRLGVSRGSVREALGQLEQLGLVEIRRGGGAIVRPLEEASLDVVRHLLQVEGGPGVEIVSQLLDVHVLLMTASVGLAVRNATEDELARARALLAELSDPGYGDLDYVAAIDELLRLVSKASRNLVLRWVRNSLRDVFVESGATARSGGRHPLRPPPETVAPAAQRISDALEARDASEAQEGVRQLLLASREQLLKRLEQRGARPDSQTHPVPSGDPS